MYVEAPRRARQPALRRARFSGHAERLDFPDPLYTDLASDRPDVHLDVCLGGGRMAVASGRVLDHGSQICAFLLRAVSCSGFPGGGVRFSSGKTRAVEPLVVALLAAILLPPVDVLRDGPIGLDRDQRRGRRLGQTGTEGDGGDRKIAYSPRVAPESGARCLSNPM